MDAKENIKTNENATYIGDFLAQDICAYCNVDWQEGMTIEDKELKIVHKLWLMENGYTVLCWPGAIFPVQWLIYRGLLPQAVTIFCFEILLSAILTHTPLAALFQAEGLQPILCGLLIFAIYTLIMGFLTIKLYQRHVKTQLISCNLWKRENLDCSELEASLRRHGRPSLKRTILVYLILRLILACISGIIATLTHLFI